MLEIAFGLVFFTTAAVIFWRKSDNTLAIFTSLMLVTFGATLPPVVAALALEHPNWRWLIELWSACGFMRADV